MAEDALPEHELPPSAKLVARVLDDRDAVTQKTLIEETDLPRRTVRHALDRLDEHGLLDTEPNPDDARQELYTLTC